MCTQPITTEDSIETRRLNVRGWASDNWCIDEAPAVIVNTEADVLSLFSWGLGQLRQCNSLLDALSVETSPSDPSQQMLGAVYHFSQQAEIVLVAAIDKFRGDN